MSAMQLPNWGVSRIKQFQNWVNTTYKLVPKIKVSGKWDAPTELMYGKYGSIFKSATQGRQANPNPVKRYDKKDFPTKEDRNVPVSQPTDVATTTKDDKGISNNFKYVLIGLAIGIGYAIITKKK